MWGGGGWSVVCVGFLPLSSVMIISQRDTGPARARYWCKRRSMVAGSKNIYLGSANIRRQQK